ncbi:MAG: choice-of-anchor V domain-containing protein [Bacteroidota bacterium]
MKRLLIIPLTILLGLLIAGFSGGNLKYPSGAPAGNTGSPGDGQNCAHSNCHSGTATTVAGLITSTVPAAGYTPGTAYTITVTVSGSGNKGFEASPQNATGTLLGSLTAGSGSKLVGSNKYVTHTSGKNTNPAIWTFTWTAPAAGTGAVTMYGAMTINMSVTKLSTLVIPENVNISVPEPELFSFRLYPNPATDLITVSYYLGQVSGVKIELLNNAGQMILPLLSEDQDPGEKYASASLKGKVKSGIYFLRLSTSASAVTKKLIVL